MEIIKYPNPILKEVCKPVKEVTKDEQTLAVNMLYTLSMSENGVGLSAPQVGQLVRLIVMDLPDLGEFVMFNPKIVKTSKGKHTVTEGCLSFPGVYIEKRRYKWVAVEFLDYDGNKKRRKLFDLAAQCVQHECEHLDGILMIGDNNEV